MTRDERVVSGGFDACVVACGAAVGSIAELSGPSRSLPLSNQGGYVVELVPKPGGGASPWDENAPGILGAPYVAPLGVGRLLVGATKEFDAGVGDARRAGVVDPGLDDAAEEAADALVADASVTYPPLKGMEVDVVRYGVRANPPRTPAGSLPLVGRIEGIGEGGGGDGDGDGDGGGGSSLVVVRRGTRREGFGVPRDARRDRGGGGDAGGSVGNSRRAPIRSTGRLDVIVLRLRFTGHQLPYLGGSFTFVRTKTLPPSPLATLKSPSRYVVSSHASDPGLADSGSGTFSDGKPLTALLTPLSASVNPDWNGCIKFARGAVSMDCPMTSTVIGRDMYWNTSAIIVGVSTPASLNLTCSRLGDRTSKLALALTEDSTIGALNATRFSTRPPTPSMVWVMSPTLRPGRFSAASKNITSLFDVYTRRHLPDKAASS